MRWACGLGHTGINSGAVGALRAAVLPAPARSGRRS